MTRERFDEIFETVETNFEKHEKLGESTVAGLIILAKYLPKSGVTGADHDIIYACNIDDLIEAGITEEDTIILKELNWMIQDGVYLASFV
jgi:hypothetical protein